MENINEYPVFSFPGKTRKSLSIFENLVLENDISVENAYNKYNKLIPKKYKLDNHVQINLDFPEKTNTKLEGIEALDDFSYKYFKDVFIHVISAYQRDYLDYNQVSDAYLNNYNLQLSSPNLISSHCSIQRNIHAYGFPSHCSASSRQKVFEICSHILTCMGFEVLPHTDVTDERILKYLPTRDTGSYDWPNNRGVARSRDGSILVLVNYTDHLHFISIDNKNYHFQQNLNKLTKCVKLFKNELKRPHQFYPNTGTGIHTQILHFSYDENFGYLTTSPLYTGSGITFTVMVGRSLLSLELHSPLINLFILLTFCTYSYNYRIFAASSGYTYSTIFVINTIWMFVSIQAVAAAVV